MFRRRLFSSIWLLMVLISAVSCEQPKKSRQSAAQSPERITLSKEKAAIIFVLPTHCLTVEYPNKMGEVLGSAADLKEPKASRPIFYGCFDWHSSVHGYWSIIRLLKTYPDLDNDGAVRRLLKQHITKANVAVEMAFFNDKNNLNFERTYGWAWLLKLQQELKTWNDPDAREWATVLQPLVDLLSERTQVYLTKLVYPIRSGKHDNTAFSLTLMYEYAETVGDTALLNAIKINSARLYTTDKNCDLAYEPSGSDFLSPCLEEAYLMSKILATDEYKTWLLNFMPVLFEENIELLQPAIVSDRTDGQLVHLDGLNFSRANCLYGIAQVIPELQATLIPLANQHIEFSLKNISDDDYMGSHWLGTFALLALSNQHD
ncbi:DUF2891 domain-containing protein [Sphingobacterium deserti]|uniref:DUF2891 domain-containing protein n=1 Tax=Sphingobacterium deserti TaxID=1229276 RepID=A0A0B8T5M8_9SPHI|nr:DUF2891 domain-containing protein [Sphingobacterium deserti]KGE15958.1 hypothetical protein DI53_0073 [Sphingobacterium deserti]